MNFSTWTFFSDGQIATDADTSLNQLALSFSHTDSRILTNKGEPIPTILVGKYRFPLYIIVCLKYYWTEVGNEVEKKLEVKEET